MKLKTVVGSLALLGLATHAMAQTPAASQRITITGSSIKRIAVEGALPLQVITRAELDRTGIQSAEQLISTININGNGLDNLASNSDVVALGSGIRGNNGATSANLRGQGANATLILLNGRRIAAHGLNGGTVDLNQIPFAAVERVEVLKDGASSTYGTDAVGGVINFILRQDFTGLIVNAKADVTQHKGGNTFNASLVGGLGHLDNDGFNVLAVLSLSDAKRLDGSQRDFVNTFQPERGLSPDTRGTPFATVGLLTTSIRTVLSRPGAPATNAGNGTGPLYQGITIGPVNTLDLPGQAGCASQPGMAPYDEKIWAAGAGAQFACAYDTGKATVIQQPVKNTNFVGRGTLKLGAHQLVAEVLLGRSESAKVFSENQIQTGSATLNVTLPNNTTVPNPFRNLAYPSTGAGYARVFNALVGMFPELSVNNGLPMAFRWRCMDCGLREIETTSDTGRYLLAMEGPLPFLGGWDYRLGGSSAFSKSKSLLGGGFHNFVGLANLLNSGTLNPFLLAGESQTPVAMQALDAISARGTTLYGGKFTMTALDATASGPLMKLPGGDALAAVGVDVRTEKFKFDGNNTVNTNDINTWIFNAPFDNINALSTVKRDVKAVFGEVMLPVLKNLEVTLAARRDDYTGFGSTTNPKVSFRFAPLDSLVLRGSAGKGFRVPTFNQLFNGITEGTFTGAGIVDPGKCPSLVVNTAPGNPCNAVTFGTRFGGRADLGPEKSDLATVGLVWQPIAEFSATLDWWSVKREGTIQSLGVTGANGFINNYNLFQDRFIRNASGDLTAVDISWINAGVTETKGLELSLRGNGNLAGARISAGLDIAYLLDKKSSLVAGQPFGRSEVGVFTRSGDLGIRWKHSTFVTYSRGDWTSTLSQTYRSGYAGYVPPGVANGSYVPPEWDPVVKAYWLYNLTVSYTGIRNLTLTAGVKNLFDKDPPFANAYDTSTGTGSSWEPRVADPRGRSFLLGLEYRFF